MKKLILILCATLICTIGFPVTKNDESNGEFVVVQSEPITYEVAVAEVEPNKDELMRQEAMQKMEEIKSIEDEKKWFIAYKEIIYKYINVLDPPETIFDYFTEDEVRLICKAVETEAYDQNFISKANVANVVLNRYYSGDFGETITEIVTSPYQFAYGRENITEDTILAVMYSFEVEDTTNGALFFHSNKKTNTFCGANYIFTDDSGHHFYK